MPAEYDAFISHASEDKVSVARPLAGALTALGLRVWIDAQELKLGDQLRRKINDGLSRSRFGVVLLSRAFFSKSWPQEELDALLGRESVALKVVLPVRHGMSHEEVRHFHPTLANKLSTSTDIGIAEVAKLVADVIFPATSTQSLDDMKPATQGTSSSLDSEVEFVLGAIKELEDRAAICIAELLRLNDPLANEQSSPVLAANMPSHDEHGAIDRAIVALSERALGRPPNSNEWTSHYIRMLDLGFPKTAFEGTQGQLTWLRLSRTFVRKLNAHLRR